MKASMEEEKENRSKKEAARRKAEENEMRRMKRDENRVSDVRGRRDEYFQSGPEVRDRSGASLSQAFASQSHSTQVEDSVEFSVERAAQRGREIRARAKEEEEERLKKKKEEARKQAERNEERKKEMEKIDVEDLRAKRLAALGL